MVKTTRLSQTSRDSTNPMDPWRPIKKTSTMIRKLSSKAAHAKLSPRREAPRECVQPKWWNATKELLSALILVMSHQWFSTKIISLPSLIKLVPSRRSRLTLQTARMVLKSDRLNSELKFRVEFKRTSKHWEARKYVRRPLIYFLNWVLKYKKPLKKRIPFKLHELRPHRILLLKQSILITSNNRPKPIWLRR